MPVYISPPIQSTANFTAVHDISVNPRRVSAATPRRVWPGAVWRYPDADAAALVAEILAERDEVIP